MEQALDRLASINPSLRIVVELRVFEGLTGKECAARMGVGTATVSRYWDFARQWLEDEFAKPVRVMIDEQWRAAWGTCMSGLACFQPT